MIDRMLSSAKIRRIGLMQNANTATSLWCWGWFRPRRRVGFAELSRLPLPTWPVSR
jgi:hypothetical protein